VRHQHRAQPDRRRSLEVRGDMAPAFSPDEPHNDSERKGELETSAHAFSGRGLDSLERRTRGRRAQAVTPPAGVLLRSTLDDISRACGWENEPCFRRYGGLA